MFARLENKTVLITGASAGIGEACALEYAASNTKLILAARRMDRLEALKATLLAAHPNLKVHLVLLDVRDRAKVFETIASLPDEFKNIDILVNNAGKDPVDAVSDADMNTMLDTNVKGLMYMTQAVLPIMKQRNSGWIVNIGSIAGTEAYAGGSMYCASKHAVTAITKSLRHELISTGINVTSIEPGICKFNVGWVETEFSVVRFKGDEQKAKDVYKGMDPLTGKDIAETVVFSTSRPPHVQIASMIVFPTNQASVSALYRRPE